MKITKPLVVSAATFGLVLAPVAAQAAPARSATPAENSESIAGGGTILYVALAAFAITLVVLLANNDDRHVPASP